MYNKVTLVGRVGKKPEIKDGNKGNKFCRFTIACNSYQNGKESTQWFNVICFGKCAEACSQLSKWSNLRKEWNLPKAEYSSLRCG